MVWPSVNSQLSKPFKIIEIYMINEKFLQNVIVNCRWPKLNLYNMNIYFIH